MIADRLTKLTQQYYKKFPEEYFHAYLNVLENSIVK